MVTKVTGVTDNPRHVNQYGLTEVTKVTKVNGVTDNQVHFSISME